MDAAISPIGWTTTCLAPLNITAKAVEHHLPSHGHMHRALGYTRTHLPQPTHNTNHTYPPYPIKMASAPLITIPNVTLLHVPAPNVAPVTLAQGELSLAVLEGQEKPTLVLSGGCAEPCWE